MKSSFQATFREKSRHMSFVVLCVALIFSVTLMIPRGTGIMRAIIINPDMFKQANNASWASISVSFMMGFFLPLIGATFLRNAIRLDRENGTMTLFLTTKFSRFAYLFGKFISNICFMLIFWGVLLLFSLIGTLLVYQTTDFNLGQFLMPFIILLPGLVFISAITLLTEVVPGLRGRIGTAGLVAALVILYASGANYEHTPSGIQRIFDVSGSQYLIANIKQAVMQTSGEHLTLLKVIGASTSTDYTGQRNLIFPMLKITSTDLLNMIILVVFSFCLVCISGFLLEHKPITLFDVKRWSLHLPTKHFQRFQRSQGYLSLRLLTGNVTGYWLLMMFLIWLWNWGTTYRNMSHLTFPLLFLTAIPLFSELGAGSVQNGIYQWLRTIPNGQWRQTSRECIAGIGLAVFLILPVFGKLSFLSLAALLVWGIQLSLVSQALGRYTSSKRPVQLLMVVFFYLYLNGAPLLPFNQAGLILPMLIYLVVGLLSFGLLFVPKSALANV